MRLEYGTDTTAKVVFEDKDFPKRELLTDSHKIELPENYSGTSEDPYLVELFNALIEINRLDAFYIKEMSLDARYAELKVYLAFVQRFNLEWDSTRADVYRSIFDSEIPLTDMQILYILANDSINGRSTRYEIREAKVSKKNRDLFWTILEKSELYPTMENHSSDLRIKPYKSYLELYPEAKRLPTPTQLFYYRASGVVHYGKDLEVNKAIWEMILTREPEDLEKLVIVLYQQHDKIYHNVQTVLQCIKKMTVNESIKFIKETPAEWLKELGNE